VERLRKRGLFFYQSEILNSPFCENEIPMRILPTLLLATLLIMPLASSVAQSTDALRHFDYDHNAPLDIKEAGVDQRGNIAIHDISYASPKGGRVPAYLVVPSGKGPFAAVIWGHWYWENSSMRNRREFLDEAVAFAHAGVVSLLTDGPIARPGHVEDKTPLNDHEIADLVQQIVDMRRGADLLLARSDVEPRRLAYVGHSYNATVGAFLSGIDKRFMAFVLMAGGLSDAQDLKSEEMQKYRQKVGPQKFDAFFARYAWCDPGNFISHAAPAEVFLQYASQEKFLNPQRARAYYAIVSEPKKFKEYDAPHALNAEARRDRIAFLTERLHLKPLDPALIASVPDLEQPPEPPDQ
jgi:cephalosporin-C deacetylase-like acetyl esterase